MKIAVVNNFFPPRVGGSAHLSSSLATAYAAAGHDVRVLTASRTLGEEIVAAVLAVIDESPGVGWGIDGDTVLLVRGGRDAGGPSSAPHWVEDVDQGLAALVRIDRALPIPLLRP